MIFQKTILLKKKKNLGKLQIFFEVLFIVRQETFFLGLSWGLGGGLRLGPQTQEEDSQKFLAFHVG
jgi:hypothetical protein